MSGISGISGNLFLNQLFKNLKSGILVGFNWDIVIKQYITILINKIKTLKYKKTRLVLHDNRAFRLPVGLIFMVWDFKTI
ncbi:Uncharacterised protein [Alysiella crassa]|uniref:Uncharacterized protein n=1 Tax=Alysiella crassa TaxID=153491 RepID=A0A376BJV0_9NEIS|nr:Uncharacterised protein [Alysiella crassa]